jgi:hypothetical protein
MPSPNIRVTVVTPEAPTHLSKTGEPTTISVKGLVKYIVIAVDEGEGLAALELDTPPSVDGLAVDAVKEVVSPTETSVLGLLYPEEMSMLDVVDPKGTAVWELLYPDETPVLEVLALEGLEKEEGMGPAELVVVWVLPPEPIVGEGMTSVWLLEVWSVESDPDIGALGEVSTVDDTGPELDIGVLVLSSPKLLDNCEVITEVITVNESMAEV